MHTHKNWGAATLLVLALTTALACSSTPAVSTVDTGGALHLPALPSYTFYVDQDVDVDGRLAIAEAQRQWTEFTNVQITVIDGPLNCFDPGCFSILEVNFAAFNNLIDGSYIGYTVPYVVFLSTGETYDELQDTAIHEMGHALGLLHPCTLPCSTYAVMNPSYRGGEDHVGCLDVDQYYEERPADAGMPPMACVDTPGPLDEAADGGPVLPEGGGD